MLKIQLLVILFSEMQYGEGTCRTGMQFRYFPQTIRNIARAHMVAPFQETVLGEEIGAPWLAVAYSPPEPPLFGYTWKTGYHHHMGTKDKGKSSSPSLSCGKGQGGGFVAP